MQETCLDENFLRLPLRPAQQSLWFLDRLGAGKAYNVALAIRLIGPLDIAALKRSLEEIIRRHESLRAVFPLENGNPVQAINPEATWSLSIASLEEVPTKDRESDAMHFLSEQAEQEFNLSEGPLVSASLVRLDEQEHILLAVMPEIICDPWSLKIFVRELAAFYSAFCSPSAAPKPLSTKYSELVRRESKWFEDEGFEKQLSFWRQNLENCSPLQIRTDRPRSNLQSFNGATRSLRLSEDLTARLKELSRLQEVSLFALLLAAFQTLLYQYTDQDDIIVGSPVDTRHHIGADGLIGCFINTLVMRSDLSGDPTFRQFLAKVRDVVSKAEDHQDIPFARLVQELRFERSPGNNPLFQVMFVLYQALETIQATLDLKMIPINVSSGTAEFDLTLYAKAEETELELIFEYSTDLFEGETISRMLGQLNTLLESVASDPDQQLALLPLLDRTEQAQILQQWNDKEIAYPTTLCFNQLFQFQAEQTPDATAVIFEDQQITYRNLNERANRLAHRLINLGIGPEVPVGLLMWSSLEAMISILAIMKAGGVFLPLDPDNPRRQIELILDDAQPSIILTQSSLRELLPENACPVICLDESWNEPGNERVDDPPGRTTAENLCAIFFTSGSTGRPKGVMTPHRTSVSRLFWVQDIWKLNETDRFFIYEGMFFASSITQLFLPSASGGQLVIGRPGALDLDYLAKTISTNKITLVGFPPSLLRIFLLEHGNFFDGLRHVFCSAEALPNEVQRLFFDTLNGELHKFYGLTEAPGVAYWHCSRSDNLPGITIGRPSDMKVYLLDSKLQPVPIGIPGQIFTGGISLTRGYLNRPDLTADRYIPDPFSAERGARMYRTGDIARWLPDGEIEFLGRVDHQVNMFGYRIELGEIEAALSQHPCIKQCAVALRSDGAGQSALVAYIVATSGVSITDKELKDFLSERLADHKIPSIYRFLESMPLLLNGKINRLALPPVAVNSNDNRRAFAAPRNEVEKSIAGIWAQILRLEQVDIYENFFALGGNSLLGVQMIYRVSNALQTVLPVRILFEAPTVADLAERIVRNFGSGASNSESK